MLICIACRFAIIDHTAHMEVCAELTDMMSSRYATRRGVKV